MTVWESRADHERWWFSDELSALRQEALSYYHKPVDQHWHARVAEAAIPTNGASASSGLRALGDQPQLGAALLERLADLGQDRQHLVGRRRARTLGRLAAQTRRCGDGGSVGRTTRSERRVASARSGSRVTPSPAAMNPCIT